ncbi:MAG: hypothetical protein KDC92_01580 [Bacteroidetes bacterium]|nr:hypothetical protein [Bacteroidota bacterium]
MDIIEVNSPELAKEFLMLPVRLYKGDKNYIRPLNKDVDDVFDQKKNKFFRHGELCRWLLKDNGQYIGRIAAFINNRTAKANDQPTGGMGFFECTNNQEAANKLFDTCRDWLAERGMEAMDGPINFGERDKFWGMLIEPFDPPTYNMNYNFPYYQELIENYGFQVYFKQFTYFREFQAPIEPEYAEKAKRIQADTDYTFEFINKKDLPTWAEHFRTVYNSAWGGSHKNFKGMHKEQAMAIMKTMKPVMIDELVWFGFYKGEPICFFIMLPELNHIFKHVNGKLDLIGKLKFAWYRYVKTIRHTYGVVFGVVPQHRGKGVEGAMVLSAAKYLQPKDKYRTLEMNWIGDFNPKMIKIVEAVGGKKYRTYHTYRYLFDREKEFKRYPMI